MPEENSDSLSNALSFKTRYEYRNIEEEIDDFMFSDSKENIAKYYHTFILIRQICMNITNLRKKVLSDI